MYIYIYNLQFDDYHDFVVANAIITLSGYKQVLN
jgi:hypothetical protein